MLKQEVLELKKELEFLRDRQKEEVDPEDLILCSSNDNAKNNEEQSVINDNSYEQYLKSFVATNSLSLKINVYTIRKPYSEWTLNAVSEIFELPTHYKDISKFTCGTDKLEDEKSQRLLLHLIEDLKIHRSTIRGDSEAYNSKFVLLFLAMASSVCNEKVKIYPKEYIQGKYGCGPVDFCMILENIIISVLEVKKDDFIQDDDIVIDKAYGIVTDSKLWYFFECYMNGDKPEYKIHSEEGTSINWGSNFEEGVTEVLGQIVWLFKDAEKLIESAKQKKYEIRIKKLEQSNKENINFKDKVMKLRNDIEKIKKKDQIVTNIQNALSTEEILFTSFDNTSNSNNSNELNDFLYEKNKKTDSLCNKILDNETEEKPCSDLEKWSQPKLYDMKTITNLSRSDNISSEVSKLE
ncbi:718_t:CDS:2 [Racocetra fulgida]|uniref:718_t:CDS:1 n=1 Tax=Racocetra fulgida TaxID=60492 RepID=A0A9N8Z3D1_9GLOM|nr:718_t:CDS:2 [Racocetra fulgida]